jgi:hypothetical protein
MPVTPAGLPSAWVTGDTVYGICCCRTKRLLGHQAQARQALLVARATVCTGQPLALDVLQFGTGEDRHIGDAVSSGNPCAGGLVCL